MDFLIELDTKIFLLINGLQNKFLNPFALGISLITEAAFLWFLIIFLILFFGKIEKKRKILLILLALLLNSWLVNVPIKIALFCRTRPFDVLEGVKVLGKMWKNCSFPSGHLASSTATLLILFYLFPQMRKKWLIILSIIFILFLAFSRIYVGMHYPLDVLAGILIGLISAAIVIWFDKQIKFI